MKEIFSDKIVYLDSEFISSKYEEIKKVQPNTEFTKVQGGKANASLPFFSAGVHTQEIRKFKISSIQMFLEIKEELLKYEDISIYSNVDEKFPKIGWVTGKLSTSEWRDSQTKELDGDPYFYIGEEQEDNFPLIAKSEYFSSGVSQLLNLPTPFQRNIGFQVKALIKIFHVSSFSQKYYISTPFVIHEYKKS